jgi:hypothetical protein
MSSVELDDVLLVVETCAGRAHHSADDDAATLR